MPWREVLGFGDQEVLTLETVHDRFRARLLSASGPVSIQTIINLTAAMEAAQVDFSGKKDDDTFSRDQCLAADPVYSIAARLR